MKTKKAVLLWCLFLGGVGAHRFYLNQNRAWWYLAFFWTYVPGIIAFFEFWYFVFMSKETFDKYYNLTTCQHYKKDVIPIRFGASKIPQCPLCKKFI